MTAEVPVTALPWDSEFWAVPTGRVHLDAYAPAPVDAVGDAIARAQEAYDFVQILVPAAQVVHAQAAQRAGFLLVDVRCQVVLEPAAYRAAPAPDPTIRAATSLEVALIAELAAETHRNSRFGTDPHLDPARVGELYRRWIHRDVAMPGWALRTAERAERIAGYVSFGQDADGDGTIGLVGVAPFARGAGLGLRLVAHAVDSLVATGSERITVVTQGGSAAAIKTYQATGFEVACLGYWLHWHRDRPRCRG